MEQTIVQQTALETAISIAINAHKGIVDKGGQPYLLHPIRVMQDVNGLDAKIVAVLHDVIEDSDVTSKDLEAQGIPPHCINALECLTHTKDVSYMDYIEKVGTNELATIVKLADLKDNSDLSRLKTVTDKDMARVEKYKKARLFLEKCSFPEHGLNNSEKGII